jgi:hypothetical protein
MLAGMGLDPSAHPATRGFLAVSYFWQGGTERSRPFPTNQPKVYNYLVVFFDTQGGVSARAMADALPLPEAPSVKEW